MALPNLELKKEKFTDYEKSLVDRLNRAFPFDPDLMALLDVVIRKYFKCLDVPESGRCDCGRDLFIQALCNVCDRDE
jgi:hypothetical protein